MWIWFVVGAVALAILIGVLAGTAGDCSLSDSSGAGCSKSEEKSQGPSSGCGGGFGSDGYDSDDDDPPGYDGDAYTDGGWSDGNDESEGADLTGDGTDGADTWTVGDFADLSIDVLDFGIVPVGQSRTLPVRIDNRLGEIMLVMVDYASALGEEPVVDGWQPIDDITVVRPDGDPVDDFGLPTDGLIVWVSFAPTRALAAGPLGTIAFATYSAGGFRRDNQYEGTLELEIRGSTAVPRAIVSPSSLPLGGVRPGAPVTGEVTIQNVGTGSLVIEDLALEGAPLSALSLVAPDQTVLAPEEVVTVLVIVDTSALATGTKVDAALRITTNDALAPVVILPLTAVAWSAEACALSLSEGSLDFGFTRVGATSEPQPVTVTNVGSGHCMGFSVRASLGEALSAEGELATSICEPPEDGGANWVELAGEALATKSLAPGDDLLLGVRFVAPPAAGNWRVPGRLHVVTGDPGAPTDSGEPSPVQAEPVTSCNFAAGFGTTGLLLTDEPLDLGTIPAGCPLRRTTLAFGDASLCHVALSGCPPSLSVVPIDGATETCDSPLPSAGQGLAVVVDPAVAPPTDGAISDTCAITIESTDPNTPLRQVPLEGAFGTTANVTEEFRVSVNQSIGILLVLDMGPESAWLRAKALGALPSLPDGLPTEQFIRAGVSGPDALGTLVADEAGVRLLTGKAWLIGLAEWLVARAESLLEDPTAPLLIDRVLGALGPLMSYAGVPPLPEYACTDDCAGALLCLESEGTMSCDGPNVGLADNRMPVHVLVVSAREDAGAAAVADALTAFHERDGFSKARFLVHVVAGLAAGCTSDAGSAAAAPRLVELAQATGGQVLSACAPGLATTLLDLAATMKVTPGFHRLRYAPVPETLEVARDGTPCPEGWIWDPVSGTVRIDPEGACAAETNQVYTVTYDAACSP